MAYLLIRRLEHETVESRVETATLRIGRGTNAELRFDDAAVALEHAVVERTAAGWQLSDRGSVTGTYLNGKRVEVAPLAPGDVIGIGGFLIRSGEPRPDGALPLRIQAVGAPAELEKTAGTLPGAQLAAPTVDFAGAYRLRRPLLTKASLGLLGVVAAAAAVLAIPWLGWATAFQPGPVLERHAQAAAIRQQGCFACHAPWRGATAERCASCHVGGAHQAGRVVEPPCAACHAEHRGSPDLTPAGDRGCVACHRDPEVRGQPRFAARVTRFGDDHPELALDLPGGRRLPLSEPAARRGDGATLRLNHRVHLQPGLLGPRGRVQLTCASCHETGAGRTGIVAVSFERHCRSCHPLAFDDRLPERQAPHTEPQAVADFLLRVYVENPDVGRTLAERRRRLVRGGSAGAIGAIGMPARVLDAESTLFKSGCPLCHLVDLDAVPLPAVAPTAVRPTWLPHVRFSHRAHEAMRCLDCHAGAAASEDTADVLLPGIAACGGCHGGGDPPAGVKLARGRDTCEGCHTYHPPQMRRAAG